MIFYFFRITFNAYPINNDSAVFMYMYVNIIITNNIKSF